jgi:hypothetical protein
MQSLPDAVALSATFLPETNASFAAFYGCTDGIINKVCELLGSFKGKGFHPLAIVMAFAELERRRLINRLERERRNLEQKLLDMDGGNKIFSSSGAETAGKSRLEEQPSESARLWLSVSRLKNSLENWKAELSKIASHCEDLSQRELATNVDAKHTGSKIEARLGEMMTECDAKIRDCQTVLDGMVIATQLVSADHIGDQMESNTD